MVNYFIGFLKMDKIRALKENLENFDKFCCLGSESKGELDWF